MRTIASGSVRPRAMTRADWLVAAARMARRRTCASGSVDVSSTVSASTSPSDSRLSIARRRTRAVREFDLAASRVGVRETTKQGADCRTWCTLLAVQANEGFESLGHAKSIEIGCGFVGEGEQRRSARSRSAFSLYGSRPMDSTARSALWHLSHWPDGRRVRLART